MTIAVANVELANTFGHWIARTNELATAMSTRTVTADSNTTPGNVAIGGTLQANAISAPYFIGSGNVTVSGVTLVIDGTAGVSTVGSLNVKGDLVVDSISRIQIAGANTTNFFLTVDPVTGNAQFSQVLIPISQLTDVQTNNAVKDATSILRWNPNTSNWETNTISVIEQTAIGNLSVANVTSDLKVLTSNTNLSNTLFTYSALSRVGINTTSPAAALDVNGTILATGDVKGWNTSDSNFKKEINPINKKVAYDAVKTTEIVTFVWDDDKKSEFKSPALTGEDAGVIAQTLQEHPVLGRLVKSRPDGTLAVDYEGLIPYMMATIQALQEKVEALENGG